MTRSQEVIEKNRVWVDGRISKEGVTEIAAFTDIYGATYYALCCADGRIPTGYELFSLPTYIAVTHRTPGAVFRLGWHEFGTTIANEIARAGKMGCSLVVPCIAHYSARGGHNNCAACNGSRELAFEHAKNAHSDLANWHKESGVAVFPLVFEIETDSGEVELYGSNGQSISASALSSTDSEALTQVTRVLSDDDFPPRLYPSVVRLLRGNYTHVQSRVKESVVLNDHEETMIALGVGYNFLPIGEALRLSPFRPDLEQAMAPMCGVLAGTLKKMSEAEVEESRPLLLVALAAGEGPGEPYLTRRRVAYLTKGALSIMKKSELSTLLGQNLEKLEVLTATVNPDGLLEPFVSSP